MVSMDSLIEAAKKVIRGNLCIGSGGFQACSGTQRGDTAAGHLKKVKDTIARLRAKRAAAFAAGPGGRRAINRHLGSEIRLDALAQKLAMQKKLQKLK